MGLVETLSCFLFHVGFFYRISLNRDGSVLIREAKREDSGNYTCTINANGNGVDSIIHKLTVQGMLRVCQWLKKTRVEKRVAEERKREKREINRKRKSIFVWLCVLKIVPPLAPLMSAAGTSFSTVNLQWKLSDSGGAPIKGYVLHVKASDEWIERRLSRHLNAYELQGLECGTYYQVSWKGKVKVH